MEGIIAYIKESYNELAYKVTWPDWLKLQQSTVLVIVASLISAFVIFFMDVIAEEVLRLLIYGYPDSQ